MLYSAKMPTLPVTEPEIDVFLAAFEGGTLAEGEWTHAAHLLTGACYVHALGREAASDEDARVCRAVQRVRRTARTRETSGTTRPITVMWIQPAGRAAARVEAMERAQFAALAVEQFRSAIATSFASTTTSMSWARPRHDAPGWPPDADRRFD